MHLYSMLSTGISHLSHSHFLSRIFLTKNNESADFVMYIYGTIVHHLYVCIDKRQYIHLCHVECSGKLVYILNCMCICKFDEIT